MCHLIYATTVNLCHLVPSTMAASRCSVSLHSQYFPRCGRRAKPCSPHLCNIIPLGHASLSSSSCFSLSCSCSLQTLNFSPRNRGRRYPCLCLFSHLFHMLFRNPYRVSVTCPL
uniref:Uncharacterized protein n=1 Tax=Opuntia streptacantha TaxID=393608 RepID=A0A7C9AFD4_OPUST